jgi:hypothetical protein
MRRINLAHKLYGPHSLPNARNARSKGRSWTVAFVNSVVKLGNIIQQWTNSYISTSSTIEPPSDGDRRFLSFALEDRTCRLDIKIIKRRTMKIDRKEGSN